MTQEFYVIATRAVVHVAHFNDVHNCARFKRATKYGPYSYEVAISEAARICEVAHASKRQWNPRRGSRLGFASG